MNFNSLVFLIILLPLFICAFYITPKKYKYLVLLLTSLLFYAYSGLYNFIILLVITLINYLFGLLISKNKNKCIFIISIFFNVISLSLFKYNKQLILPLGMSFYIFNNLTYIIDIYKNKISVEKNIVYYFIYICLFCHVTMGPILRYKDFKEVYNNLDFNLDNISDGLRRFIFGLIKKVIIADNLGILYSTLLNDKTSSAVMLLEVFVYGLQLYIDFSSYSDMAIGLGKIIGFEYSENFDYPYLALTVSDFWRRWHISLTNFFKEYVYIPLGGNRVGKLRNILNILIVWMLTGIWHGNTYNFLIWGVYYGIVLIFEKYLLNKYLDKIPNIIKHFYVLIVVYIGYIFFSFNNLQDINTFINGVFTLPFINNNLIFYLKENMLLIIVSIVLCFKININYKNNKFLIIFIDIILIALYILAISYIVSGTFTPFLYSAF